MSLKINIPETSAIIKVKINSSPPKVLCLLIDWFIAFSFVVKVPNPPKKNLTVQYGILNIRPSVVQ